LRATVSLELAEGSDVARTLCEYADAHVFELLVLGRHGPGLSTWLIAGGALTAFAYLVIRPDLLPHGTVAAAVVPLSTAVILLGSLSMVVRRHTVAQLIGWLIVENGVFLGAITLVATFPFIVEAGIFLDIVAGVLIMVVFVSGLTRQLAEASASELRELRG
jgi:hydrogenase-4 component E